MENEDPLLLKNWKYNGKTKRFCLDTDYAKYQIGRNKEEGLFLRYKLLKIYDSAFKLRSKHFIRPKLYTIQHAITIFKEIEFNEADQHARKLKKRAWLKQERKLDLIERFHNKCKNCGYDKNFAIFQFHHIDSSEKKKFSKEHEASLDEVEQHPDRFEMLCANCHIETHMMENKKKRESILTNVLLKYA